jgi:hypothetical protein
MTATLTTTTAATMTKEEIAQGVLAISLHMAKQATTHDEKVAQFGVGLHHTLTKGYIAIYEALIVKRVCSHGAVATEASKVPEAERVEDFVWTSTASWTGAARAGRILVLPEGKSPLRLRGKGSLRSIVENYTAKFGTKKFDALMDTADDQDEALRLLKSDLGELDEADKEMPEAVTKAVDAKAKAIRNGSKFITEKVAGGASLSEAARADLTLALESIKALLA